MKHSFTRVMTAFTISLLLAPAVSGAQSAPAEKYPAPGEHQDESDWLATVMALEGGAGMDTSAVYVGLKMGLPCCRTGEHPNETALMVTADLGYDRLRSKSGVSAELSTLLPVVRFARPTNERQNYLRIYAGPGGGFRVGGGANGFVSDGQYLAGAAVGPAVVQSVGVAARADPYRFPSASRDDGDIRITVGLMVAWCKHCGLD